MMENLLNFKDRVVLVTGSARGIGLVIAKLFADHHATVVINDKTEDNVNSAVSEVLSQGGSVFGFTADVTNAREVSSMIKEVEERTGHIDVLVNNAAMRKMDQRLSIEEITETEWEVMIRTNLNGIFNTCRAVVPIMKKQKCGSIVNISSQAAVSPPKMMMGLHYITSKGAVIHFTKGLAREVGDFNIRVNTVVPGFIQTEHSRLTELEPKLYARLMETIMLRRLGLPQEVANACLFLASDMSSYITGEIIAINGGMPSIITL